MSPGRQGLSDLSTGTPRMALPTLEAEEENASQGSPESPRVSGYLLPTPEWHTVVVPQALARHGHGQ